MRHIFSLHHDILAVIWKQYTHPECSTITEKIWTVIGICDYKSVQTLFTPELPSRYGTVLVLKCLQQSFQNSVSHRDMLHFRKNCIEGFLIHAVYISTSIHSHNDVVVVGPSSVTCYGRFEVFPFIELSPVGFNIINHFKHTDPWWIWLSVSKFINVGVIIVLGL